MTQPRHRWGEPNRLPRKTERECLNGCGIVKVTRHEGQQHWIEFWCIGDIEKLDCDRTPPCVAANPAGGKPVTMEA